MPESQIGRGRNFDVQLKALRAGEAMEAAVRRVVVDVMLSAGALEEPRVRIEELREQLDEWEELLAAASEQALAAEVEQAMLRAQAEGVPPALLAETVVDRLSEVDATSGARGDWDARVSGRAELRAVSGA